MTSERLCPEISCRFWQAPYSTRPAVGCIGPLVLFKRQPEPSTSYYADSDVEDDPTYRPRGGFVWTEEEIILVDDNDPHPVNEPEPAPTSLDPLGDLDLSDPDDYDTYEKEDRTASRR